MSRYYKNCLRYFRIPGVILSALLDFGLHNALTLRTKTMPNFFRGAFYKRTCYKKNNNAIRKNTAFDQIFNLWLKLRHFFVEVVKIIVYLQIKLKMGKAGGC